jgi:hypothetical protein
MNLEGREKDEEEVKDADRVLLVRFFFLVKCLPQKTQNGPTLMPHSVPLIK